MKISRPLLLSVLLLFIPHMACAANSGDFDGGVAIGSGYAGISAAPTNGAIIQGNVGIGTTSPATLIDVYSATATTGIRNIATGALSTTSGGGLFASVNTQPTAAGQRVGGLFFGAYDGTNNYNPAAITGWSSEAWSGTDKGSYIAFETTQTGTATRAERMRVDNTGHVGIGTTTPVNPLDIYGSVAIGSSYAGISAAPTNGLLVQGSVGMGTTSPVAALDVYYSGNTEFAVRNGLDGLAGGIQIDNPTASAVNVGSFNGAPVTLITNNAERMRITTTGQVGIDTTTPVNPLDVYGAVAIGTGYAGVSTAPTNGAIIQGGVGIGTATLSHQLQLYSNNSQQVYVQNTASGGYAEIGFQDSASDTGFLGVNTTRGMYMFYNGITALSINPSGNVGIGTTSPSYTLQVNGSVAGSSAYVNTSDVRYKKNIAPLDVGLEEVEQLQPVSFEWKSPKDAGMEGEQMGFVAQDVEKILPSVVLTEDNDEKTKGIKYSELIPVLVKAIQEQQTEIKELKETVTRLEQQKQPAGDDK